MVAEWYYAKNKQKVGPVTEAQLQELVVSGELTRNDMVWQEGMAKWTQAGQVKGLFDAVPIPILATAPPPLPDTGTEAIALVDSPAIRSPDELKLPVIGMFTVSALALLFGLVGVLGADRPVVRILLAIGVAHNIAAIILTANVVRLRNYGLASVAPWVVMTCWMWHWFTNMTHGMTLLGMVLAGSAGVWAYFVLRGQDVRRAFDANPPLPPLISFAGLGNTTAMHYDVDPASRFPWATSEREQSNPKLKFGTWAVLGVAGFALLLIFTNAAILGLWLFGVVFLFSVFWIRVLWGLTLRGRWLPVDGQLGWVEFLPGNLFKKENGTVGSYVLLRNQNFIDFLISGQLVDSWKILSRGDSSLEIQDMTGKTGSFKKGKTLAEKQASLFHKDRTDDLPGSWMPIDGSGKWVQFTKDGAIVFSDGSAGKYKIAGEEPNEIIYVKLTDEAGIKYRLMSLSNTQLVIVEGTTARTYSRHGTKTSAAASTSPEQAQGPSQDPPGDQGTSGGSGGILSGMWNWLAYWNCPKCGKRAATKTGDKCYEEGQRVQTGFDSNTKTYKQMVYSYGVRRMFFSCKACGHEWVEDSNYSYPA